MTPAHLEYLRNRLARLQKLELTAASAGNRYYTDQAASKLEAAYLVALEQGFVVGPVPRTPTLSGIPAPRCL